MKKFDDLPDEYYDLEQQEKDKRQAEWAATHPLSSHNQPFYQWEIDFMIESMKLINANPDSDNALIAHRVLCMMKSFLIRHQRYEKVAVIRDLELKHKCFITLDEHAS